MPNSLHFEWAKKSLENNLHVICEKPLTCNLAEAKVLVDLAKRNNLILIETFQFRFHKQFIKILELIRNDEIGKLKSVVHIFI